MNITFAKRHTSIVLQPFDDKWRDLNISSRDLTLPSMSEGVTEEMSFYGWPSSFSLYLYWYFLGLIFHDSAISFEKSQGMAPPPKNAGKTVFWVFLTMHYLKSPICFLISISRKLKSPSRILHCRKQLMSEEKWGKLKVPRFSGKTGGIHTFSKYRWLFTYHNSPGKANELQNEIILKEKRCHKGLRQQP